MSLEELTVFPYKYEFQEEVGPNRESSIRIWCKLREEENTKTGINRVLLRVENFMFPVHLELPQYDKEGRFISWNGAKAALVHNAIIERMSVGEGSRPEACPISWQFYPVQKLYYYQGDKKFPSIMLTFLNRKDAEYCRSRIRNGVYLKGGYKLILGAFWGLMKEIDIVDRFLTIKGITQNQWLRVKGTLITEGKIAQRHPEYLVLPENVEGISSEESVAWKTQIRQLGFDIETYSDRHNAFPQKEYRHHVIFACSVNFKIMGQKESQEDNVIVYGESLPIFKGKVWREDSELDLLIRFAELVHFYDPDFLIGHNIFGYDIPYMDYRMRVVYNRKWPNFTNLRDFDVEVIKSKWSSSAYAFNNFTYWNLPGMLQIDTLPYVQRDHKLPSYNLNSVSKKFLGKTKHPISAKQMFQAYHDLQKISTFFTKEELKLLRSLTTCDEVRILAERRSLIVNELLQHDIQLEKLIENTLPILRDQTVSYTKQLEIERHKNREKLVLQGLEVDKSESYHNVVQKVIGCKSEDDYEKCLKDYSGKYKDCIELEYNFVQLEKQLRIKEDIEKRHDKVLKDIEQVWTDISLLLHKRFNLCLDDLSAYMKAVFNLTLTVDYCRVDSVLPIEVFEVLNGWIALTAFSAINRIGITELFTRGQQYRIMAKLSDICWNEDRVIDSREAVKKPYKGAFVGEAKPGMHHNIITIDFESLYPSIMIAYNICHTTLISKESLPSVPEENYNKLEWVEEMEVKRNLKHDLDYENVFGLKYTSKKEKVVFNEHHCHHWLKREVKQGLLPKLLQDLLDYRKKVKKLMNEANAKGLKLEAAVNNARQLAAKVAANSIYGFTGAQNSSKISCVEVAASVTYVGRCLIKMANQIIEEQLGYKVIYNDTDSCMVDMHLTPEKLKDFMTLVNDMLDAINSRFPSPIRLAYEKLCSHFLLITPKRYAMVMYKPGRKLITRNDIEAKGLIIVRRDNCAWMRQLYTDTLVRIFNGVSLQENIAEMYLEFIRLMGRGVNWKDLAIIIKIGANYKNEKYMLKLFADRLKTAGKPVEPGDRVEYLVVKSDSHYIGEHFRMPEEYIDSLSSDKPELIDYAYYIERRMLKQLEQLIQAAYNRDLEALEQKYRRMYPEEINVAGKLYKKRNKLYTRIDKSPVKTFLKIIAARDRLLEEIRYRRDVVGPDKGLNRLFIYRERSAMTKSRGLLSRNGRFVIRIIPRFM